MLEQRLPNIGRTGLPADTIVSARDRVRRELFPQEEQTDDDTSCASAKRSTDQVGARVTGARITENTHYASSYYRS
eukprot:1212537-Pleurochrysis_carterae.AAC.1